MDSLRDLFVEELKDIYNAENQLLKALPKMAKAATNEELRTAFETHLEETREHINRLEQVFEEVGQKVSGKTCHAMKGLIEEAQEVLKEGFEEDAVMDAALIAAAQRVEHYEIAVYGTLRTFAEHLELQDAVELLQTTLDEEGAADKKLTAIAESGINFAADTEDVEQEEEQSGGRRGGSKRGR